MDEQEEEIAKCWCNSRMHQDIKHDGVVVIYNLRCCGCTQPCHHHFITTMRHFCTVQFPHSSLLIGISREKRGSAGKCTTIRSAESVTDLTTNASRRILALDTATPLSLNLPQRMAGTGAATALSHRHLVTLCAKRICEILHVQ
jgi:hypothetical protein